MIATIPERKLVGSSLGAWGRSVSRLKAQGLKGLGATGDGKGETDTMGEMVGG
jgi:hypothetical protein